MNYRINNTAIHATSFSFLSCLKNCHQYKKLSTSYYYYFQITSKQNGHAITFACCENKTESKILKNVKTKTLEHMRSICKVNTIYHSHNNTCIKASICTKDIYLQRRIGVRPVATKYLHSFYKHFFFQIKASLQLVKSKFNACEKYFIVTNKVAS